MKSTRTSDLPIPNASPDASPDGLSGASPDEDREYSAPVPDQPQHHFIDLSAIQLAGGALAAATAAWLGSRLGLAGTLAGAIIASLLTATASAVYTASLRRGRERVRAAVERVRPQIPGSQISRSDVGRSEIPRREPVVPPGHRFSRLGWRTVLVAAAAVLVTALAGITGIELLTGHALSGGSGTTVQQVGGDQPKSRTTTPRTTEPKSATSTSTIVPRPTATVTVTATASPTPNPTPTATSTSSEAPSPTPSKSTTTTGNTADPTPTPSATPAPTATP